MKTLNRVSTLIFPTKYADYWSFSVVNLELFFEYNSHVLNQENIHHQAIYYT